jgi:hypothetical protein
LSKQINEAILREKLIAERNQKIKQNMKMMSGNMEEEDEPDEENEEGEEDV